MSTSTGIFQLESRRHVFLHGVYQSMPLLRPFPLPLLSSPSLLLIPQFSTSFTTTTTTGTARHTRRTLTTTPTFNMPEPLKASHIDSKTDPTVANQWDHETPKKEQIDDFYKTVDGLKIGLLATIRPDVGIVSRSMAVAKVPMPLYPSLQPHVSLTRLQILSTS